MTTAAEDGEAPVRPEGRRTPSLSITDEQLARMKQVALLVVREPFTKRPWTELAFYLVSGGLAAVGLAFVGATMITGIVLAITFFGLAVLALSLRSARGIGRWHRDLAHNFLGETVPEPEPFTNRPGFFGWLQAALRDRVAWRAVAYLLVKVPWTILGGYVAFSLWWDAFSCLLQPLWGSGRGPGVWGLAQTIFLPGAFKQPPVSFWHGVAIFIVGFVFLLAAPWVMRGFVNVDRLLIRSLLGPDPVAARVRNLEQARTRTVDASAAMLRRIERDLHDGTQAQLVALAMRLGMAKEKLDDPDHADLERVRRPGRGGPPGSQGGHYRAARHRAGHPPAGPRHRAGGGADDPRLAQRHPHSSLVRPA